MHSATPQPTTTDSQAASAAATHAVRQKARLGMLAMGVRSVLQQLTILAANVYLARLLSPADYGVFAVVQISMALFAIFGDVGLGASLIQKREAPSDVELSTAFWFQLALGTLVLAIVFAAAPFVLKLWPELPAGTDWLLRGLALTFFFTMLRVVPSLLLERKLRFGYIALVEFLGTLAFYGTALVLALRGSKAASLIAASVAQAALAALALNLIQRWRPRFAFDRAALGRMLRFGLAFQGKTVTNFVNSAVTPVMAGNGLGLRGLGLVNFAQSTAWFPLQLVSIVSRVSFPAFSRLQHDRAALAAEVERAVLLCATPTLFFSGLCLGLGPDLIEIIYSQKWVDAVPAIYAYAVAIAIGFVAPVIAAALDALGRPHIVFRLSIVWSLLNWVAVTVALSIARTPLAFAIGYCVHVVLGNLAVIVILKRWLPEASLGRRVRASAIGALLAAALGRFVFLPRVDSVFGLALAIACLVALFLGVVLLFDRSLSGAVRALLKRNQREAEP